MSMEDALSPRAAGTGGLSPRAAGGGGLSPGASSLAGSEKLEFV